MKYKEIFRNDFFLIVDKAAMVLSVPARDQSDERLVLGKILEKDYHCQIYPVHRLDFEVSGLIVYAFRPDAHKAANRWFELKEVNKTYHALTSSSSYDPTILSGAFVKGEVQIWKSCLLRGKKRAYESPHGKAAETHATVINEKNGIYQWELNPITGRSHQLRFELFRHHQPILKDDLYGANGEASKLWTGPGIALRAFRIDFTKASGASNFFLPDIIEVEGLKL